MEESEKRKKYFISAVTAVTVFLISIRLILFGEGISPSALFRTLGARPYFILIALAAGAFVGLAYWLVESIVGSEKKSLVRWAIAIGVLGLIIWGVMISIDCWANPGSCSLR